MACKELTLQELIERLHELFASDDVDVDEVQHVMEMHQSKYSEWKKFANFDPHRYTRNLVDSGNDKFNLILLCWSEGHGSGIHDHANANCWMKVMDGALTENLYNWPSEDQTDIPPEANKMMCQRKKEYTRGQVAYINDTIGLHRIENNSHTRSAVSLHLYSPPFDMCHSFDERTGKVIPCHVRYWSKYGERTPLCSALRHANQEQN